MFGASSFRAALLLSGAAVAISASPAWAQSQSRTFDIPAQPASSGIPAFAEQADVQILVAQADTRGRRTMAVRGAMTVTAGLERLLAGSGLVVLSNDGRTITLGVATRTSDLSQSDATTLDEVIVTAQKREEHIQDVPIAITALSEENLEAQQIEGGYDLLRAIPNVTFSKSNYSGYNFSIRGVGTKAVSAASDPGVAISFNNVALIRNRLFEQEYLDIERVEVLRGPQGTLYGRNATAGVVNLIPSLPELGMFDGEIGGEVGSYGTRRMTGMINLPLGETFAVRVAAASTRRDGFGENLTTGNPVDGRDLWTGRAILAWEPTDRFRANLTWEHFEEDDDRLRTGKQLCHRDPGPDSVPGMITTLDPMVRGRLSQGCKPGSLYSSDAFGTPNGLALPFVVAGQVSTVIGLTAPGRIPRPTNPNLWMSNPASQQVNLLQRGVDPFAGTQSRDLREIESAYDPRYRAKADIFALNLEFDLTDSLRFSSQTLYNRDEVWSFQDYHRFRTLPTFNSSSGTYNSHGSLLDNATWALPSRYVDVLPNGVFTDPQIGPSDRLMGFEISSSESEQFSQEFRLQSSFEGPVNFSVGANYTKFEALNDYFLFYNIVTAIAQIQYNNAANYGDCNNSFEELCLRIDPNPVGSLAGDGHNYFRNKNPYELESTAAFGELYWGATDTLKVTAGLRYTEDSKSFTPWRSQLMVPGFSYGAGDPIDQSWGEFTGRFGIDWKPELSFTDDTMVYAFYSRGYKGGGANPPPADLYQGLPLPLDNPITFDPEFVNAFEIGAKNTLLDGSLVLNASAFYYGYTGYQVSKIENRTIVNENFDATIWGAELEATWRPTRNLRFNATLGHLQTEIGDGETSIDILDRTQGNPDWMVVTPWLQQTSNCILPTAFVATFADMGILPGPSAIASPILSLCLNYPLYATDPTQGYFPLFGFNPDDYPEINNGTGFAADISGNKLPNSPEWTLSVGAEYTWMMENGWEARFRGDYYWQADSYARVYNTIGDELRAWDNANLSVRIEQPGNALALELYVKNVFDQTPITDAFVNSDSTGMTTNVFTLDPRLIGFSINKGF